MNWRKYKRKKKAWQWDWTPDVASSEQGCGLVEQMSVSHPRGRVFDLTVMLFFSCPFFNSFCFVSFNCFALCYLQLPHYLFTRNYFPLHDTQPNKTNFSFSNSRTLVNQLVYQWSCAMASFWDLKIICAPSIISKTVHGISYQNCSCLWYYSKHIRDICQGAAESCTSMSFLHWDWWTSIWATVVRCKMVC